MRIIINSHHAFLSYRGSIYVISPQPSWPEPSCWELGSYVHSLYHGVAPALSHKPQEPKVSRVSSSRRTAACRRLLVSSSRHTGPTSMLEESPDPGESHLSTLRDCNLESQPTPPYPHPCPTLLPLPPADAEVPAHLPVESSVRDPFYWMVLSNVGSAGPRGSADCS